MQADVFVLHHHAAGLLERRGVEQRLIKLFGRRHQPDPQLDLDVLTRNNRQAVHRTNVDAGVTLDAQRISEVGLDVAVQAALHFGAGLLFREAFLHLHRHLGEAEWQLDVLHLLALRRVVVVAVRPLVQAHLGAGQGHAGRGALADRETLAELVNRDRGLVAVLDRPDDVGRTECRVAAKEHAGTRRHEGGLVDHRHVPLLVELQAHVALDPGERVLLADGEHHRVARQRHAAGRLLDELAVHLLRGELVELHAGELAVLDDEANG